MCAQMVPQWIPAYGQDTAVLHREEREDKEEKQEGEKEEGVYVQLRVCDYDVYSVLMAYTYYIM